MRFDPDVLATTLAPLAARLPGGDTLTPSERTEVLRLAQGFACKDSAAVGNVSPETVRARRKRIYRKLGVGGANDVISALLASSLRMLAERSDAPAPGATQAEETAASV
jgi:DNA-binding CsgD family transcriptional regulator